MYGVLSLTYIFNADIFCQCSETCSISPDRNVQTIYDDLLLLSAAKMHLPWSSEWNCFTPVSVTAECLRVCGGCKMKQTRSTEGKQRSGHRSGWGSHWHHQQHVLRDSEA